MEIEEILIKKKSIQKRLLKAQDEYILSAVEMINILTSERDYYKRKAYEVQQIREREPVLWDDDGYPMSR